MNEYFTTVPCGVQGGGGARVPDAGVRAPRRGGDHGGGGAGTF